MAVKYNLVIDQGSTFTKSFVWKSGTNIPVDLDGYIARMQVRPTLSSPVILLELTTSNSRIEITPAEGKITLHIDSTTTAEIQWVKGIYDLELESSDGVVTRLLRGDVSVSKEVTR